MMKVYYTTPAAKLHLIFLKMVYSYKMLPDWNIQFVNKYCSICKSLGLDVVILKLTSSHPQTKLGQSTTIWQIV